MHWEWIVLYIVILFGFYTVKKEISGLFRLGVASGGGVPDIGKSIERLEAILSKFYNNEWKEPMDPQHHMHREENPPTMYDFADELETIRCGVEDIELHLSEIAVLLDKPKK